MKGYEVAQGRGLQYTDMTGRKKVCIVGQYLNQVYYGGNAVGQTLRINGNSFTIVGVMGMEGTELEEGGTDDCVFLPYSTASRISGRNAPGDFDLSSMTLGNKTVSVGVRVYEQVQGAAAQAAVPLSELDLERIPQDKISGYHENSSGIVDLILLDSVTGDAYTYGLLRCPTTAPMRTVERRVPARSRWRTAPAASPRPTPAMTPKITPSAARSWAATAGSPPWSR